MHYIVFYERGKNQSDFRGHIFIGAPSGARLTHMSPFIQTRARENAKSDARPWHSGPAVPVRGCDGGGLRIGRVSNPGKRARKNNASVAR